MNDAEPESTLLGKVLFVAFLVFLIVMSSFISWEAFKDLWYGP